jgi:hypothetical protein
MEGNVTLDLDIEDVTPSIWEIVDDELLTIQDTDRFDSCQSSDCCVDSDYCIHL